MTYPYGALAMLCFALTYLYAMLVVPPLLARINARSNTRFLSPFVFHILYSFLFLSPSPPLSPYLNSHWRDPLSFMLRCTLLDL